MCGADGSIYRGDQCQDRERTVGPHACPKDEGSSVLPGGLRTEHSRIWEGRAEGGLRFLSQPTLWTLILLKHFGDLPRVSGAVSKVSGEEGAAETLLPGGPDPRKPHRTRWPRTVCRVWATVPQSTAARNNQQ